MMKGRGCRTYLLTLIIGFSFIAAVINYLLYQSFGGNLFPTSTFQPTTQNLSSDVLRKLLPPENPSLHQQCFEYGNYTATFNCSGFDPYIKYSGERIFECASRLWNVTRDHNVADPWQRDSSKSSIEGSENMEAIDVWKRPGVHFVMVGDSHTRKMFDALMTRISIPRVRYRIASFDENQWANVSYMMRHKWQNYHEAYHEVVHLDIPLKITYRFEPRVEKLPSLLKSWISGKKDSRPSALLFGTDSHFMRNGEVSKEEAVKYTDHLKRLAPLAEEFGKTTPTVFKLLDRTQEKSRDANVDRYNAIAREVMPLGHVMLWDNTLPLADIYNEACRTRKFPKFGIWECKDKKHIGSVMVDQYIDMFLNEICNMVM